MAIHKHIYLNDQEKQKLIELTVPLISFIIDLDQAGKGNLITISTDEVTVGSRHEGFTYSVSDMEEVSALLKLIGDVR